MRKQLTGIDSIEVEISKQSDFGDLEEHPGEISANGGPLETLVKMGALEELFRALNQAVNEVGYIPRSGQFITDASAHDGARIREGLVRHGNTCRDVWTDTAYHSTKNEEYLEENGLNSRIHRKKPHWFSGRAKPPEGLVSA